jgi:mono/diheme cytochrome c family protein
MKHAQTLMLFGLLLGTCATITRAKEAQNPNQSNVSKAETRLPAEAKSAKSDRGQQVFAQNCSRCHNAPQGFSSHISGTIARHMRVRAGLSDEDYKALRKFLSP